MGVHVPIWRVPIAYHNESVVSPVARRYTRVVNGRERLVVCLSEYLPLHTVYILVIKVEPGVCFAKRSPIAFFFIKCRLSLPVVHKVSGVVTMKSIDMYILHDSSLVVCFSNISA